MTYAALKNVVLNAVLLNSLLFVGSQVSFGQNIRVSNTSTDLGKGRYQWTVFLDADQPVLNKILFVEYQLDPAFDNSVRKVDRPRAGPRPFSITDLALQPSRISIIIYFKDNQTMRLPNYTLRLRSTFSKSWYVVLESYALSRQDQADALLGKYREKGYDAHLINTDSGDFPNFARGLWVVVLGPTTQTEALGLLRKTPSLSGSKPYVKQAARY
jgi:hypothetical protein